MKKNCISNHGVRLICFLFKGGQYRHNRSRDEIPSVIKKSNGSSSHDLLSGDIYKSMVIELVYVQGFEPSATAINNFF
jgi:hypothetical protein